MNELGDCDDAWWDEEEALEGKEVRTVCGGLMTVPSFTAFSQPLPPKVLIGPSLR